MLKHPMNYNNPSQDPTYLSNPPSARIKQMGFTSTCICMMRFPPTHNFTIGPTQRSNGNEFKFAIYPTNFMVNLSYLPYQSCIVDSIVYIINNSTKVT